jgi:UDP-N-acetylmuramate dehydrogenase
VRELLSIAPQTKLEEPLASHCTFHVGGPARAFVTPDGIWEVRSVLDFLTRHQIPFKVVGKGANLLVSDEGYDGVVIVLGDGFNWFKQLDATRVTVGAGMALASFSNNVARLGIAGFEFAAHIPGTVGGGIVNNCGAYGFDMAARIIEATIVRSDGTEETADAERLELAYRSSSLKGGSRFCLVQATLAGTVGCEQAIRATTREYGVRRAQSQPLDMPSAGCVFRNPPGTASAGRLIEAAGLKGLSIGNAVVSEKHANFIVNRGHAKASDVIALIAAIRERVRSLFAVELETEVEFVGIAPGL